MTLFLFAPKNYVCLILNKIDVFYYTTETLAEKL